MVGHHAPLAGVFLPWIPVEAGIYRLNRVIDPKGEIRAEVECSPRNDADLPETFVPYDEAPREYSLNAATTVLDVQTRVSDLYSHPIDQIQEQLRLLIEKVKERQESELINNAEYGLPRIPVTRVENFCASGTEALRGAVYAVAAGACDVALALGVETLADHLLPGPAPVAGAARPRVGRLLLGPGLGACPRRRRIE
ncbi:thiolase family protein [Azospirillum agricola]|uniref:thiolase family protein n=1 Tax=Azospirillum agricola TaxID=1720247 RepID=UPI0015C4121C|nr:hypothetical protein [Azospirillum agricola]